MNAATHIHAMEPLKHGQLGFDKNLSWTPKPRFNSLLVVSQLMALKESMKNC